MSILSKLFGNGSKNDREVKKDMNTIITDEQADDFAPSHELFVDQNPPLNGQGQIRSDENRIQSFLDKDYTSKGQFDGYVKHSKQSLSIYTRKIKSEFQFLIDQLIQDKQERKLKALNALVDISGISVEMKEQLENIVQALDQSISELENQKNLSVEEEGWIMPAIHSYQIGYMQGLKDYLDEMDILDPIRNI